MSMITVKYEGKKYKVDETKIYAVLKILGHKEDLTPIKKKNYKKEKVVNMLLRKYRLFDKYFLENINKL